MGAKKRFDWNGDALLAAIEARTVEAVNDTVDAARDDAKVSHSWRDDPRLRRLRKGGPLIDTHLERQIQTEHAQAVDVDGHVRGRFGYTRRKGFYGGFHEDGTSHEHAFPTIRPSADRVFPTFLARLVRRRPT